MNYRERYDNTTIAWSAKYCSIGAHDEAGLSASVLPDSESTESYRLVRCMIDYKISLSSDENAMQTDSAFDTRDDEESLSLCSSPACSPYSTSPANSPREIAVPATGDPLMAVLRPRVLRFGWMFLRCMLSPLLGAKRLEASRLCQNLMWLPDWPSLQPSGCRHLGHGGRVTRTCPHRSC